MSGARQLTSVLSGAEQYFSRNCTKSRVHLNEYQRHLLIFSLWDISRENLIISVQFRQEIIIFAPSSINNNIIILCGCLFGNYFAHQVTSMKILVPMVPKVVTAGGLLISSSKKGPKNSCLTGDSNPDRCNAGAALHQLSYQTGDGLMIGP